MRVRIRFFAMQRALTGLRELDLEVAAGATAGSAWQAVMARWPELAAADSSVRFARNGAYVDRTEVLADGDELAVIPPVAGGRDGAEPPGSAFRRLELGAQVLDGHRLAELVELVPTAADGAVAVFVGRTRESAGTPAPGQESEAARFRGQRVEGLDYEAFEAMALEVLGAIADEIEARFGVRRIAILHRTGPVALEEASVLIVAAAPHREEAFAACRYAIEELKARAPIWKAERFADGSVWLGAPARTGPDEPGPTG